jgi:hypothetical protein
MAPAFGAVDSLQDLPLHWRRAAGLGPTIFQAQEQTPSIKKEDMTERQGQSGHLKGRESRGTKIELTQEGKMRNAQAHSTETETFGKRLRAYAAGAGAAAAGLLAFSPAAMAKIVVIPAHVSIGSSPFPIDVEGTAEFTLVKRFSIYTTFTGGTCGLDVLFGNAASGVGVVAHGRSNHFAAALRFGAVIGPTDQFEGGEPLLAYAFATGFNCFFDGRAGGSFANTTNRFLGLKFELHGQVYYGWAGFSMVTAKGGRVDPVTAVLTAWAYETEPNTPIYAGQSSDDPAESRLLPANGRVPSTAKLQPATLGVLALGSLGLDVWRKRDTRVQESS